jgi:hypothetical protein
MAISLSTSAARWRRSGRAHDICEKDTGKPRCGLAQTGRFISWSLPSDAGLKGEA